MRKLLNLLVLFSLPIVSFAQGDGLVFAPAGKNFVYKSGYGYFCNTDSLSNPGGPVARFGSGHADIVHMYDKDSTFIMVENGYLIRAHLGIRTYDNRDTLFNGPVSTRHFSMTTDEKYILVVCGVRSGMIIRSDGFQNVCLLGKTDSGYAFIDSIGTKEKKHTIAGADVALNGNVVVGYNDGSAKLYTLGADNKLHETPLPQTIASTEFAIPDSSNDIFYAGVSNDNYPALCCLRWNGTNYDAPLVIHEWKNEFYFTTAFPHFKHQFSFRSNGQGVAWIQTYGKQVPSTPDDPNKPAGKYHLQSVFVAHCLNGTWLPAEKYFDLFLGNLFSEAGFYVTSFQRIYFNRNNICVQNMYEKLVYYSSTDKNGRAIVYHLHNFKSNWRQPGHNIIYPQVPDTVYVNEPIHLRVPVRNSTPDTVKAYDYAYTHSQFTMGTIVPFVNSYSGYSPDIIQRENGNAETMIAPGDTIWVDYWVRFTYSGEVQESGMNNFANNSLQTIISAVAKVVLQPKVYDPFGCTNYDDGASMECYEWDDEREVWRYRRWLRGNRLSMLVEFDRKGALTGDNTFYWENGNVAKRIIFDGNKAWRRTYYEDGALKSEQHFENRREVGTSRVWYNNGQLRSEAEFKDHLVVNIYLYKLKIEPKWGSSAKYYHEYYPGGQLKYTAFHSRAGNKKGKWRSYDQQGRIMSEYRPRRNQQVGNGNWVLQLPPLYYSGEIHSYRYSGRYAPDF